MTSESDDRVSRRRYQREQDARAEAEKLLEGISRELYTANKQLSEHSACLENAVIARTAELREALQEAEAASVQRSRFIATMSHEVRTPLGGMLGMIDLLAMDEVDPGKLELLNYAKTAGVSLNRIVNDVLDFSKMDAGVFVFEVEDIDIRALAQSVRVLAGMNPKAAGREIVVEIDKSAPKIFRGDATRIRQVLSNLVSNAIRYSTAGLIYIRVRMDPHPMGGLLHAEVEDFGVGIASDKVPDLFKDFSQISNPLTSAAEGTGLGLAICKRILEGCGGTIDVETTRGKGSTFWFDLPIEVVSLNDEPEQSSDASDAIPDDILHGKRVLLAEDNVINQKLLMTYLNRMKITTTLAENGRVARDAFEPGKFDLILMDIAMPEMDGLEATQSIREQWPTGNIPPILALTAHVMDAIAEDVVRVGIDRVLSKPIPFEELKLALETAINTTSQQFRDNPDTAPGSNSAGTEPPVLAYMARSIVDELLNFLSAEDLVDCVGEYIADSRSRLSELTEANNAGDRSTVVNQAHSLRGSSVTLGFTDIAERAQRIEGQSERLNQVSVASLENEISAMLNEIEAVL